MEGIKDVFAVFSASIVILQDYMLSSNFAEVTKIILSYVGRNPSLSEFEILENRAKLMQLFYQNPHSEKVFATSSIVSLYQP